MHKCHLLLVKPIIKKAKLKILAHFYSKYSKLPTYTALQSQHNCLSQHKDICLVDLLNPSREHPALTLPQGQRGGWSCIPSPPAPPPGRRLETPPAPAWARHLHCAAVTSGTHPGPPAHPLHMTEAIKMTRTYDQKTSNHKISSLMVWTHQVLWKLPGYTLKNNGFQWCHRRTIWCFPENL